ncbi:hypothetical protein QFW77_03590 [Luteimonas sp. RD2P54]|uniref:Uncharacterized protein n=1 Tax=Luteimonas endophytica TaxID=3042023 RepID=A0ABT6J5G7_9GAMM|nr:hypothetical protein [Luteimonas endophytica]MDH5822077.1 hypothetical protein [Luteimonas endophytica]
MSIDTAIGLILTACVVLLYLPLLIWRAHFKRRTGPTLFVYSLVGFGLMLCLGLLGLVGGFFGPLVLTNDAQGPLLAFATTPLGVVIGMLVTWGWFYLRRNEP